MSKRRKDILAYFDTKSMHPKPEEPPNGGISKDFSQNFTPNRFQTGRLSRFGVKCRLFGGERGWRAHQRQPRPNPRRTNQCTLKPKEPLNAAMERWHVCSSRLLQHVDALDRLPKSRNLPHEVALGLSHER
ncbi:hypothetical protein NCPHL90_00149 [Corynebacterium diphtheriae]|nr:hypothetical protein NCPHL90_00149 [Corynebacterium diphtheriae]